MLKSSDRQYRQLSSPKTGEKYSLSHVISEGLCARDIFISQEIIAPGSRSSAPHFHTETEEIICVLKGRLVAVEGPDEVELSDGDFICFEANSGKLHYLKNTFADDSHVLVVRRNIKNDDTVYSAN